MTDEAATALQEKIHRTIPLSRALAYRIVELGSNHITVEAPLEPNVNIHGTGFAGSIYSLGMLSAWALGSHIIDLAGQAAALVVAEASIRYRAPIRETIRCRCVLDSNQTEGFVTQLSTKGKARMDARVEIGREPAAVLQASLYASRTRSG
jgi:thioesterase domain-containing protein